MTTTTQPRCPECGAVAQHWRVDLACTDSVVADNARLRVRIAVLEKTYSLDEIEAERKPSN